MRGGKAIGEGEREIATIRRGAMKRRAGRGEGARYEARGCPFVSQMSIPATFPLEFLCPIVFIGLSDNLASKGS